MASISPTRRASRCTAPMPPTPRPRVFSATSYWMLRAVNMGLSWPGQSRCRSRYSIRRLRFRRIRALLIFTRNASVQEKRDTSSIHES